MWTFLCLLETAKTYKSIPKTGCTPDDGRRVPRSRAVGPCISSSGRSSLRHGKHSGDGLRARAGAGVRPARVPGQCKQSYTSLPPTMSFLRRNDQPQIPPARNGDAQYDANRAALLGTGGGYPVSMATLTSGKCSSTAESWQECFPSPQCSTFTQR